MNPKQRSACIAALLALFALAFLAAVPGVEAFDRANIPLKNWGGFSLYRDAVYDDLERLVTAGLADRTLLNTKPLSRVEAARIVARAFEKIRQDAEGVYNARRDLEPVLARLMDELRDELAALGVRRTSDSPSAPGWFSFVPIDRAQVFAGYANHQVRLVNTQGLAFKQGANGGAAFESRAQVGDFLSFYLQPQALGNEDYGAARLATGYVKLTLFNVELLVGRDSLWWGPGLHGSMILSNNAPPLDQIRIGAAEPFLLPWIGPWMGPMKLLFFVAELESRRDHANAKLAGARLTLAPFSFLELGFNRMVQFGGTGTRSLSATDYVEVFFDPSSGERSRAGGQTQFRDNNLLGLDADLRLRNVQRYYLPSQDLRLYMDFFWDDTCCDDNFFTANILPNRDAIGIRTGVHLLGLFGREGLDARFEYARTSPRSFNHDQYTSGYWTRGHVISDLIGTDGRDYFARITNRIAPNLMLGLELNRAVIGSTTFNFAGPQQRRLGGGIDLSYRFWQRYSIFAQYLLSDVENRGFRRGDDGLDHLVRFELTRSFR